jgi:hypothetical protein
MLHARAVPVTPHKPVDRGLGGCWHGPVGVPCSLVESLSWSSCNGVAGLIAGCSAALYAVLTDHAPAEVAMSGAGNPPHARHPPRSLVGGRARAAAGVQGPGIRRLHRSLPRRLGVPRGLPGSCLRSAGSRKSAASVWITVTDAAEKRLRSARLGRDATRRRNPCTGIDERRCQGAMAGTAVEDELASADPGSVDDPLGPGVIERMPSPRAPPVLGHDAPITKKHMATKKHMDIGGDARSARSDRQSGEPNLLSRSVSRRLERLRGCSRSGRYAAAPAAAEPVTRDPIRAG